MKRISPDGMPYGWFTVSAVITENWIYSGIQNWSLNNRSSRDLHMTEKIGILRLSCGDSRSRKVGRLARKIQERVNLAKLFNSTFSSANEKVPPSREFRISLNPISGALLIGS
jgi:hypothetical protein